MPLSGLGDLVFGGWDIFEDTLYAAALKAGVIARHILDGIKNELEVFIEPGPVHRSIDTFEKDLRELEYDD